LPSTFFRIAYSVVYTGTRRGELFLSKFLSEVKRTLRTARTNLTLLGGTVGLRLRCGAQVVEFSVDFFLFRF
jgi:hypothetical protein